MKRKPYKRPFGRRYRVAPVAIGSDEYRELCESGTAYRIMNTHLHMKVSKLQEDLCKVLNERDKLRVDLQKACDDTAEAIRARDAAWAYSESTRRELDELKKHVAAADSAECTTCTGGDQ